MWHRRSNIGLKFVLVEQIHNARLLEGWQWWPWYLQLSKLVLPFLGVEMMGSTPGQLWPGRPCKTYISSPAIIFRGILVFFQASRPGHGIHWHSSPSAPPTAGMTQIGGKLVHVQTVFQNALYWPKLNSQHTVTSRIVIFVFWGQVLSHDRHFNPFCLLMDDLSCRILNNKHTTSELEKSLKKLCSSHYLHSKCYFQLLKGSTAFLLL